jgi:hypothetical protein
MYADRLAEMQSLDRQEEQRYQELVTFYQDEMIRDRTMYQNQIQSLQDAIDKLEQSRGQLKNDLAKQKLTVESKNSTSSTEIQKLNAEIQRLKRQTQEVSVHFVSDKRVLEKQLSDAKRQAESEKSTSSKFEKEVIDLRQQIKKLQAEITELKNQAKRTSIEKDKAIREQEKLNQQHKSQINVFETKLQTVKNKLQSYESEQPHSPTRSIFPPSPLKKQPKPSLAPLAAASTSSITTKTTPKQKPTTTPKTKPSLAPPSKSAFSTTPFLKKNVNFASTPGKEPKEKDAYKSRPSLRPELEDSFVVTSKNSNQKISIFDEDDDDEEGILIKTGSETKYENQTAEEDVTISPLAKPLTKSQIKRRKRKLKAASVTHDIDNPDEPGSVFKRVKKQQADPTLSLFEQKISPLRKNNEGVRNLFKV